MKDPYEIVKARYITEKATVLEKLQTATSSKSLKKCLSPKYVFLVDIRANKREIASAFEEIYKEQKVKVTQVNTLLIKGKLKKRGRGRGRPGQTASYKKAVITLTPGDAIENL